MVNKTTDNSDTASLLLKAISDQNWKRVTVLIKACPQATKNPATVRIDHRRCDVRLLPLHMACALNPDEHAIDAFLDSYPEAVAVADTCFDRTPLHYACLNPATKEGVVRDLLRTYPDGAHRRACRGRLALHYAVANGSSPGVVAALLEYNPAGVCAVDDDGKSPTHLACARGASVEVVRTLLRVFPECAHLKSRATTKTTFGNGEAAALTPIEWARAARPCANRTAVLSFLETLVEVETAPLRSGSNHNALNGTGSEPKRGRFLKTKKMIKLGEYC